MAHIIYVIPCCTCNTLTTYDDAVIVDGDEAICEVCFEDSSVRRQLGTWFEIVCPADELLEG